MQITDTPPLPRAEEATVAMLLLIALHAVAIGKPTLKIFMVIFF